jgi:hypothetical protein
MKRILIVVFATLVMTSTAAGAGRPLHDKKQAEVNLLKGLMVAAMKNPRATVGDDIRAICTGVGYHRGVKYGAFRCRVTKFDGAKMVVRYVAQAGGRYKLATP